VSTEDQRDFGWTLDEDRRRIAEKCDAEGWSLAEVFDDGGLQGDDPDRPGFNRMLASLADFDVIVLRDLSRLSRDLELYARARNAIRRAGVAVHTFDGPVRLDTLESGIKALIAEEEKREIGRRVRLALDGRARAGEWKGGPRPFGYRMAISGAKSRDGRDLKVLEADPVEAATVRRIFEATAAGMSQRALASELTAERVPTAKGGTRWRQTTIRHLLKMALYRPPSADADEHRTPRGTIVHNDQEFPGRHAAIVSWNLWHEAQPTMSRPSQRGGRPPTGSHLLRARSSAPLICTCGAVMMPRVDRPGSESYVCSRRRDLGADHCAQRRIGREKVDVALIDVITHCYLDLEATRDRLNRRQQSDLMLALDAAKEAEREQGRAEAGLARVKADYVSGDITAAEWRDLRADLEDSLGGARGAVEQAHARVKTIEVVGALSDAQDAMIDRLAVMREAVAGRVAAAPDLAALRNLIRQLFERVEFVRGEDWPEPKPDPLPEFGLILVPRPEIWPEGAAEPQKLSLSPPAKTDSAGLVTE
jgi:site-specific DNA recombinase